MAGNDRKDSTKVLAGTGAVLSVVALITALRRPAKAAAAPPTEEIPPTVTAVLDEETRQALAAILSQQVDTLEAIDTLSSNVADLGSKLDTANQALTNIAELLGAAPAVPEEKLILQPFQLDNQTLQSGTPFPIYQKSPGKGALIWAVVDVSSPSAKLALRFDDLVWEFEYSTLRDQGVDSPLAPGVWLSKYDAANSHFAMIFSAGAVSGFAFKQRLLITVTYTGTGTAILKQGRGVVVVAI